MHHDFQCSDESVLFISVGDILCDEMVYVFSLQILLGPSIDPSDHLSVRSSEGILPS